MKICWEIVKRPRGFEIHWRGEGHQHVASYPKVREHIPCHWLFYPYVLWSSIRAVKVAQKTY